MPNTILRDNIDWADVWNDLHTAAGGTVTDWQIVNTTTDAAYRTIRWDDVAIGLYDRVAVEPARVIRTANGTYTIDDDTSPTITFGHVKATEAEDEEEDADVDVDAYEAFMEFGGR